MMKIAKPRTGRLATGIDHAKLRRWEADLNMKEAALQGVNVQLRGNSEHAGMKGELGHHWMLLQKGLDAHGRALLAQQPRGTGPSYFIELERVDAEKKTDHIRRSQVDMNDVHYCVALEQDIRALQERTEQLLVEIAPLRSLVAACRAYVEEQS